MFKCVQDVILEFLLYVKKKNKKNPKPLERIAWMNHKSDWT